VSRAGRMRKRSRGKHLQEDRIISTTHGKGLNCIPPTLGYNELPYVIQNMHETITKYRMKKRGHQMLGG